MDPAPTAWSASCVLEAGEPWSARGNNFPKGAKWSPDGRSVLSVHEDARVRLWQTWDLEAKTERGELEPAVTMQEGGPILDFCFFPRFSWDDPSSCCFLTCSQGHPIHLCAAHTGSLCNSYRPYNNVDEVTHAFSLCFSLDGARILAGFPHSILHFDLQRPGRQVEEWLLSTRKGRGQKGIIGALVASPTTPGLYAAGSYNRSIGLYHTDSRGKALGFLGDSEEMMGGVTQLIWHDEHLLLSGHRCDRSLRVWDLRKLGGEGDDAPLLHRFPRPTRTHQRFLFSARGDLVATGTDKGDAVIFSLSTLQEVGRVPEAHSRPCVSAMLHPEQDFLLTASGARHFPDFDIDSPPRSPEPRKRARSPGEERKKGCADAEKLDNSVRIWRLRPQG